jgi:hypothetical protein
MVPGGCGFESGKADGNKPFISVHRDCRSDAAQNGAERCYIGRTRPRFIIRAARDARDDVLPGNFSF